MEYPRGVKEELNRITAQDPKKLSADDLAYLKARSFYLDYQQAKKFESVLGKEAVKLVEPIKEVEIEEKTEAEEIEEKVSKPRAKRKKK